MGITYDTANPKVIFAAAEAEKKFKHLLMKLVISPQRGLGATASFDDVFADYGENSSTGKGKSGQDQAKADASSAAENASFSSSGVGSGPGAGTVVGLVLKPGALFAYPITINSGLISQLMKEAREINCKKFPAATTFLRRNIVEAILKHIIDQQKANPASKTLALEECINLCGSNNVSLGADDRKILKEFSKNHLLYLNLGAHANVIPNPDRVLAARDCIDQFVKRNV